MTGTAGRREYCGTRKRRLCQGQRRGWRGGDLVTLDTFGDDASTSNPQGHGVASIPPDLALTQISRRQAVIIAPVAPWTGSVSGTGSETIVAVASLDGALV
jgi:hypothetical protein